jgi:uncharacterized protein (DUF1697 family)
VTRYAALLRGINVGTAKRVAMADLRALLTSLGYDDVTTLLNSGNAVFSSSARPPALERAIEKAIESELGVSSKVLVRSGADLAKVVKGNPFPKVDPKKLAVTFLSAKPAATKLKAVGDIAPDEFRPGDRVVYLHQPNGFSGSKLPDFGKLLGLTATARNWATTTKLRDLTNP